jgi:ATP-dependent Clp protease ATP-binding subunit ClpA
MSSEYKIKKVHLEDINFTLLIIELPEDEIEDKLAYFAKEKGRVSKEYYDDYLLATCVANINQMLKKLSTNMASEEDNNMEDLRTLILSKILEYNPKLNYDNITINKNGVLKLKEEDATDCTLLSENKFWLEKKVKKPSLNSSDSKALLNNQNEVKPIEDLKTGIKKIWWKRLGRYVDIKKFDSADLKSILQNRVFQSRTSFATFVVTLCVTDFESLFQLLDNMGVPARVAPPLLMHELHELCLVANPFLTFDNAQDILALDETKKDTSGCNSCKTSNASEVSMGEYASKNKQQKLFKDVPKEDLLNLATNMKVSLIGQNKAVDSLTEAIQRAGVGLKNPDKPIGSFLFAGRTGVGKSLTTKVLADELVKDRNNLITIDCSEYSADHEYSKLIGSPPGYINSDQGGILTNAVLKNPFSVVVFDEIEKASNKVYQLLLQVLEEGRLTDNKGTIVPFKDTVIILTSNIGANEVENIKKTIGFGEVDVITEDKKTNVIEKALKKKFKPEFLNRLDEIIYFNDLTKKDYERIIDIELYKLNDNLQANDTEYKSLTLEFDEKIRKIIYKEGVDDQYGARPIKRAIERIIATPLAVKLLSGKVDKNSIVNVSSKRNKSHFEITAKKEDDTFYMVADKEEGTTDGD